MELPYHLRKTCSLIKKGGWTTKLNSDDSKMT